MTDSCCLRCGRSPTIDAHLLPRAFCLDARVGLPHLIGAGIVIGRDRRSPTGPYDPDILCADCDGEIGKLDDYAVRFVRHFNATHRPFAGNPISVDWVDVDRLVRFALSIVWRYSISSRIEAKDVKLRYFGRILERIVFGAAPVDQTTPVMLWAYHSDEFRADLIIMAPTRWKCWNGATTYGFLLGGFRFAVQAENWPRPPEFAPYIINGKTTLAIPWQPLEDSLDWEAMTRTLLVNAEMKRQQ